MKALLQRVSSASVTIENKQVAHIKRGLLIFIGFGHLDTTETRDKMIDKICHLRLFEDQAQKMNLNIQDIDGEILVVSQFTLYGNCKKGRRPNFLDAMKPDLAEPFYDEFVVTLKKKFSKTRSGVFGADMKVSLLNDGPVTVMLEQ
jgi:D-aminoacyl-tRNA deacylase